MRTKICFFFLMSSVAFFAQNKSEIEVIKKEYDTVSINKLKKEIVINQISKENTIKKLLEDNNLKRSFISNGNTYEIIDVIDGKPVYQSTENRLSAMAAKTNTLYPGGNLGLSLTGSGMKVGVWDGSWALVNHQEFMNGSVSRITTPDTAAQIPSSEQHATHVTGTVCGKGVMSSARGMAYEANVASYNWTNDKSEVTSEATNNGLLISNHSYGVPIIGDDGSQNVPDWYMGCYNNDAYLWDQISHNLPYYLMVASAGNSGLDSYPNGLYSGFDKLTGNKNCKNNLVVANANPTVNPVTGNITNLIINNSSSQGPTDDGRIKPDIAADGTNLYSASNESTTSYATLSGTSMASPSTAGSLILLQQHYNNLHNGYMKSATLKGLACHTAVDDTNFVGPDPFFGWGFLNTRDAAQVITNSNAVNPTAILQENTLNQTVNTFSVQVVVSNPKTLKATICWNDVPGTPKDNQLNSSTPVLVNDLDLRIIKGEEVNLPWKLDLANINSPAIKGDNIVDNVERVEVENASGTYTIQVTHKGTLVEGSQNFGLIVTGFDQVQLSNNDFIKSHVSIFPNPVNDELNVSSNDYTFISYELFDIQGRVIKRELLSNLNDFKIDTTSINNGMYMLNITTNEGSFVEKIIKK